MPPGDYQRFTCLVVTSTASAGLLVLVLVLPVPFAARPARSLCPVSCLPLQLCSRHWGTQPCLGCKHSVLLFYSHQRWSSCRRSPAVWWGPPPSCSPCDILDFIPVDPPWRLASLSAVAQIQPHLLSWDDPLKFWGLMRNSLSLSFVHTPAPPPPPQPLLLSLFLPCVSQTLHPSSLVSRHHWGLNVMESGLTSVRRPDSWPADVYYFCGLFIGHTHKQRLLGLGGGGCHGDNRCASLKIFKSLTHSLTL